MKSALVSINAITTNSTIAQTIKDAGADYLLAVRAIRQEVEQLPEALKWTRVAGPLEPVS